MTLADRDEYEMTRRATGLPAAACWDFVKTFGGTGFAASLAYLRQRCWEEYSDHPHAAAIREARTRGEL